MGLEGGRQIVFSVGNGDEPEWFLPIAGIRAREVVLSTRLVDATTAQSQQGWRELIASAATKRIEIAGSGAFFSGEASKRIREIYFGGEAPRFEVIVKGLGVLDGPFVIAELSYGGEHDSETKFSIRLASAGVISFTPPSSEE